jgi:ligand-binding SRPBCC domain-containing protein
MIHRLVQQQVVPAPLDNVWEYFCTVSNLNEITPPSMQFEIIYGGEGPMFQGKLIEYRVQIIPMIKSRWLTEITHVQDKAYFVDEQRIGPYSFWYHEHYFDIVESGTRMTDRVTYSLPLGPFGGLINSIWVKRKLEMIFNYRSHKMREVFEPKSNHDES